MIFSLSKIFVLTSRDVGLSLIKPAGKGIGSLLIKIDGDDTGNKQIPFKNLELSENLKNDFRSKTDAIKDRIELGIPNNDFGKLVNAAMIKSDKII